MAVTIDILLAFAAASGGLGGLIGGLIGYESGYNQHKMETLEKQAE